MSTVLFIVVFISSVAYILGGLIVLIKKNWSQTSVLAITAMSAGLLLSIAILDLIPDTQEELKNSSLFIMLGLILMYLVSYFSRVSKKGKTVIGRTIIIFLGGIKMDVIGKSEENLTYRNGVSRVVWGAL